MRRSHQPRRAACLRARKLALEEREAGADGGGVHRVGVAKAGGRVEAGGQRGGKGGRQGRRGIGASVAQQEGAAVEDDDALQGQVGGDGRPRAVCAEGVHPAAESAVDERAQAGGRRRGGQGADQAAAKGGAQVAVRAGHSIVGLRQQAGQDSTAGLVQRRAAIGEQLGRQGVHLPQQAGRAQADGRRKGIGLHAGEHLAATADKVRAGKAELAVGVRHAEVAVQGDEDGGGSLITPFNRGGGRTAVRTR